MDFALFHAGFFAMKGLAFSQDNFSNAVNIPENGSCSFCRNEGPFFWIECDEQGSIDFFNGFLIDPDVSIGSLISVSKTSLSNENEPEHYYRGCPDCLRNGTFVVWHYTELGEVFPEWSPLKPEGFQRPSMVSSAAVSDLLRTPGFNSWQDHYWLLHCNDFMVYVGEWGQKDFDNYAPDGAGEALFAQVVQDGGGGQGKEWGELMDRDSGFHVFRCGHCGVMRAILLND